MNIHEIKLSGDTPYLNLFLDKGWLYSFARRPRWTELWNKESKVA